MAGRGVHFAVTQEQESRLLEAEDDEEVMEIIEEIEEAWDKGFLEETDKAWDAIHRSLTDGTLSFTNGLYPLTRCILGGRQLYKGEDYIVSFVTRDEVRDVAQAMAFIDKDWLRDRYFKIDPYDYGVQFSEEDFEYTWDWFEPLRSFFQRATDNNRSVIFTVDQ